MQIPSQEPNHVVLTPAEAEDRLYKSRASWLYWVAGFSALNTISVISGSNRVSNSLGIAAIIAQVAKEVPSIKTIAAVVALTLSIGIAILGYFATAKKSMPALVGGFAIMCIDTLIIIGFGALFGSWPYFSILIHIWTCASLFLAVRQLMK